MSNTIPFSQLDLQPKIQEVLVKLGFETASEIQTIAIPVIQAGRDVIGLAQTGTGKTAAFSLSAINNMVKNGKTQLMILVPTRELALQVETEVFKFSKELGFNTLSVYGGSSYSRQLTFLKKGVEILVATPGRLQDLLDRKAVDLSELTTAVLDEADEMLNMGFIADIENILRQKPASCQTLLFSATMPKSIQNLSAKFLKNPEVINVVPKNVTKDSISQVHFSVHSDHKLELISRILHIEDPKLAIIFANTKSGSLEVALELRALGFKAEAINGDLDQNEREKIMARFRNGISKILVGTDVAARGIDVKDVDLVINYDLPFEKEYYVHRICRTGRAGRTGNAYSFVCNPRDKVLLRNIEQYAKTTIARKDPITTEQIYQKKLSTMTNSFIAETEITKRAKESLVKLQETYSLEDIALNLLTMTVKEPSKEIVTKVESRENRFNSGSYGGNSRNGGSRTSRSDAPQHPNSGRKTFGYGQSGIKIAKK